MMAKMVVLLCIALPVLVGAEILDAELGAESAWTGEGVPLYITLRASGPFSGTASFDLPETTQTFFIKAGSPTVGSETALGKTWITQRHEFRIYTQKSGEVLILPIQVRFKAKKDFISQPEPHSGETAPLHFRSRRPPGTADLKMVVSATAMRVEQIWPTKEHPVYEPGDVIVRRIIRRARGTTGMVFAIPDLSAPDGVRVYTSSPVVNDKVDRGKITAERVDVIKYQFSTDGSFELPELTFSWWDSVEEKLKMNVLPGKTFIVKTTAGPAMNKATRSWKGLLWMVPALLLLLVCSKGWTFLHRPERRARRAVVAACRAHDPKATLTAVLAWKRRPFSPEFSSVWNKLSEAVYSKKPTPWNSADFNRAFRQELRNGKTSRATPKDRLPPLNPTD